MPRAARCEWPGLGSFATGYGASALDYLRRRSRENPWFAVASAVMHAGRIGYNIQQRVAEKVIEAGPEAVMDIASTLKTVGRAQDLARVASSMPVAAACYRRFCQQGSCIGDQGKMSRDGEALVECMRSAEYTLSASDIEAAQASPSYNPRYARLFDTMVGEKNVSSRGSSYVRKGTGIGHKTRNLLAEYLGCDDAVAMDTHVANWLSSTGRATWIQKIKVSRKDKNQRPLRRRDPKTGELKDLFNVEHVKTRFAGTIGEKKALTSEGYHVVDRFDPPAYGLMKREFQRLARECDVPPADLQVGAWAQGTCDAIRSERRYGSAVEGGIYLGEGRLDSCENIPRLEVRLSDVAVPLAEKEKGPGSRFECRPGYFGQPPSGVRVLEKLPKAPPDEIWTYQSVGRPVAMRQLPEGAVAALPRAAVRPEARAFAGRKLTRKKA